ncbi:MAG: hypothetical protein ACRCW2_01385 [Cellulosilyticaceae bacterium]
MATKECVGLAERLREKGNTPLAYALLRKQYEQGAWQAEEALVLTQNLEKATRNTYETKLLALRAEYIGMK